MTGTSPAPGTFSPLHVGNNILHRAFYGRRHSGRGPITMTDVSPMKLQRLLYLVASEYATDTGETLLYESFKRWSLGPVSQVMYDKFHILGSSSITRYARDAMGRGHLIDEGRNPALRVALDRVWMHGKLLSAVDLSRATRQEGSAWHAAFAAGVTTIDDQAMIADITYRRALGIH
jgi:uncharacterized phage-associated protein